MKYPASILFCITLGLVGGYAIGLTVQKEREVKNRAELEQNSAVGLLYNASDSFVFLTEHIEGRDLLKDDTKMAELLISNIRFIIELDDFMAKERGQGATAVRMSPETRIRAERALNVLQLHLKK